jgi:uncharacterized membrane protein YphA (DoxX/SURF4 family)
MDKKKLKLAGTILICLVGIVLVLAGVLKLIGVGAEDMVEGLKKANLIQHQMLISITAILCGTLLMIPQTRGIGVLMATAYWGGAIVAHLTYNDSIVMPAVFQGLLWVGVLLAPAAPRSVPEPLSNQS